MDLKDIPLEQLLGDLQVVAKRDLTVVEQWIKEEQYYPGQTRVGSSELYGRFVAWATQQPDITKGDIPDLWRWGVEMTARFKKGRSKHGLFYYISRESDVSYPT
jgi:hypothetical protein